MDEKQNEPVACVHQENFGRGQVMWLKEVPPDNTYLYTTPQTKPLSGGEILEIASNVVCSQSLTDDWRIHFARAIEAKVRGES